MKTCKHLDPLDSDANWEQTVHGWETMLSQLDRAASSNGSDVKDSGPKDLKGTEIILRQIEKGMKEWLVQIRTAGLKRLAKLEDSSDCLRMCFGTARTFDMEYGLESDSSIEFRDIATGNVVYSAIGYPSFICCVMKELFVAAWTTGDPDMKSLVENVLGAEWYDEPLFEKELLRGEEAHDSDVRLAQRAIHSLTKKIRVEMKRTFKPAIAN